MKPATYKAWLQDRSSETIGSGPIATVQNLFLQIGSEIYRFNSSDVWEIKREYWQGAIKTPTKLPTELIEKILDYSSEEGDVVLDPFLGSGQVTVVSKMKERHYIGFEIVPAYYEFAIDRLESGKYLIQKTV